MEVKKGKKMDLSDIPWLSPKKTIRAGIKA
jgi:hypothetical protein